MTFVTPQLDFAIEPSEIQTLNVPEIPPVSLDYFPVSSTFIFNQENIERELKETNGGGMPRGSEMNIDQFAVESAVHEEQMRIRMDDPILSSLQTLAEGRDFAEAMGEGQNFNVWEWFEQQ